MAGPTTTPSAPRTGRPRSSARRIRRLASWLLLGYAASVACFHLLVLAGVMASRALGHDTRRSTLGTVQNLRPVDGQVWASGQPDSGQYRELADEGLQLVVDLRSGVHDDPILDDPALLGELGVERVHLPVGDGRALSPDQVDELMRAVGGAGGLALLHCGGGVGRSNTAAAAYLAATDQEPSVLEAMAVGPMTLQQLWYVAVAGSGNVPSLDGPVGWTVRRLSETLDAPRRGLARARSGDAMATVALVAGVVAVPAATIDVLRRPRRPTTDSAGPATGDMTGRP